MCLIHFSNVQDSLHSLLDKESLLLQEKARENWIKDGDRSLWHILV